MLTMLDHEPFFGKNVIETLSEGMYDNPLFLFREYVQNAADAIDAAVRQGILSESDGQIIVSVDANERCITFEDNGTGIPAHEVNTMLANIGASQKNRKTDKGFRGIGRLGGLGYCQKVRFETSIKGETATSCMEWDARNLHELLANPKEKISAGQLIQRITSIWRAECDASKHFFKVSLINVNKESDELLDVEEVRKYLSMVAPVPFDYAKFPFISDINSFLQEKSLSVPHEYRLYLNNDEVHKGYETPLKIDGGKTINIFQVVCRAIAAPDGKSLGWYWFGVSTFDGVLPKKCWQRNIRLRKANIQIGEADCLSNHPKRGDTLWKEDRGNNYFIGEVHALDPDLIPNSRRDYFNQDEACRRFEKALQDEFQNLDNLYHKASQARSAQKAIDDAKKKEEAFRKADQRGEFIDSGDKTKKWQEMQDARKKAESAQRTLKTIQDQGKENPDFANVTEIVVDTITTEEPSPKPRPKESDAPAPMLSNPAISQKPGYMKERIPPDVMKILQKVFEVLGEKLPEDEAELLKKEILKEFDKQ